MKKFSHSIQENMVHPKKENGLNSLIYKFYECETSRVNHNSGTYIFIYRMIQMTHTWLISLKSWLTSTMPPSKSFIASASASIVSMSKWFVGSSSSNRWGACHAKYANTTRQRCPSLNCRIGHT
jgi:hypothetical protein